MHFGNFLCVLFSQLEMEDGDEIDAMLHQTGGTAFWLLLCWFAFEFQVSRLNVSLCKASVLSI